jgi:HK97 family phage major capsid protein/HK97 family phage prohead protease
MSATDRGTAPDLVRRTFDVDLDVRAADEKARTVPVSFSSQEPVKRGGVFEVLDHGAGAVDLRRAGDGLPLLLHHDATRPIGVVEKVRVEGGRCRGVARFGESALASEVWQDVRSGVLKFLSVGYSIDDSRMEPGGVERVTRWTPFEVSVVGIPADATVGVNRARARKEPVMTEQTTTAAPAAAPAPSPKPGALDAERARVTEILAIAAHDNYRRQIGDLDERARRAIADGASATAFGREVLDALGEARSDGFRAARGVVAGLDADDESRMARGFSIARAVRAVVANDWREAGREREVSAEIARRTGRATDGFYVPPAALAVRMTSASNSGGALIGEDHRPDLFIEALRAEARVLGLGATLLTGLSRDVAIPRMTGGATTYWLAENAGATKSAPTFDSVVLKPKQLGALVGYSRKLLVQSDPGIEQLLRSDLLSAIAVEVDRCAIAGSADADAPTGLLETAGVDVTDDTASTALTHGHFADLVSKVEKANAARGRLGFLSSYTIKAAAMVTEIATGSGRFIADAADPETILGFPAAWTSNVPEDVAIFGNWADLLVGQWGGIEVIVDPYSNADTGYVRMAVHSFWDFAVRRPKSFAAYTGLPTTIV